MHVPCLDVHIPGCQTEAGRRTIYILTMGMLQVLILLPMRSTALRVVSRLCELAQKETRADSIQNKAGPHAPPGLPKMLPGFQQLHIIGFSKLE